MHECMRVYMNDMKHITQLPTIAIHKSQTMSSSSFCSVLSLHARAHIHIQVYIHLYVIWNTRTNSSDTHEAVSTDFGISSSFIPVVSYPHSWRTRAAPFDRPSGRVKVWDCPFQIVSRILGCFPPGPLFILKASSANAVGPQL